MGKLQQKRQLAVPRMYHGFVILHKVVGPFAYCTMFRVYSHIEIFFHCLL